MIRALKQLAHISAGYSFRGKIIDEPDACALAIQMKNLSKEDGVRWGSTVRTNIPSTTLSNDSEAWLRDGDIIFTARGNNNYALKVSECRDRTVLSPHLFRIRINDTSIILPDLLAWQINQKSAQKYFARSAEGSAIIGIRRAVLDNLPIIVPPLNEQHEIVKTIHCWRKQRDVLNALQNNHLDIMNTIAKDLLTRNK